MYHSGILPNRRVLTVAWKCQLRLYSVDIRRLGSTQLRSQLLPSGNLKKANWLSCCRYATSPESPEKSEEERKAEARAKANAIVAELVAKYENWLKRYPKAYRIHRQIVDG